MTDDQVQIEIAALREQAARCTPPRSILESIEHTKLMLRLSALQDEIYRRRGTAPLAFNDWSYSRARRRRKWRPAPSQTSTSKKEMDHP
jgi:hypothetical protein